VRAWFWVARVARHRAFHLAAVHGVDRDLALSDVTTLERVVQDSLADERFRTTLLSAFAAVALLLAALGIYGVLAYLVSQRSREFGIRLALGAHPASLFRLVIKQGMRPVLIGASGGLLAAIAVTGTMRSLLFGVTPINPATYAVAIAALAAIAATACRARDEGRSVGGTSRRIDNPEGCTTFSYSRGAPRRADALAP